MGSDSVPESRPDNQIGDGTCNKGLQRTKKRPGGKPPGLGSLGRGCLKGRETYVVCRHFVQVRNFQARLQNLQFMEINNLISIGYFPTSENGTADRTRYFAVHNKLLRSTATSRVDPQKLSIRRDQKS
jgi:hypothetical protein